MSAPSRARHCIGAMLVLLAAPCPAETPRHPHVEGFSGSVGLDYDGSRARTDALRFGVELEWGSRKRWLMLAFDQYADLTQAWAIHRNTEATVTFGTALWRDNATRCYVNATLDVDVPSLQASRGVDITPEINFAKGITEDWWIGGSISAVLATSPDEGNRQGYASATLWLYWATQWLPNESDSLTLSVWAATSEVPGDDDALFVSLEYAFDITDDLEFTIGIGTDIISPWDHLGVYGTAGLCWRF